MMKIHASDCIDVLQRFQIASEESVPKEVSRLHVSHPAATNTLALFRYDGTTYGILTDEDIRDDLTSITDAMRDALPGRTVTVYENPSETNRTYGVPFEGKTMYLARIGEDKERLDAYLARTRPEYSRSSWQKLIKSGAVKVDTEVQTVPRHAISTQSRVTVTLPEAPKHDVLGYPIVYLDDDVIVIDKPADVLMHARNQLEHEATIEGFYRTYSFDSRDPNTSTLVHRLDRDTSGLVIGARTADAQAFLKKQFAERTVQKTYIAIVEGDPEWEQLNIDLPIARNSSKPGSFTVHAQGKSAQTAVKVLKRRANKTMLELKPKTGRTHQLRVHLAHLGLPIVGDRLYSTAADRLYLHATQLELKLPNGTRQQFASAAPDSFIKLMEA